MYEVVAVLYAFIAKLLITLDSLIDPTTHKLTSTSLQVTLASVAELESRLQDLELSKKHDNVTAILQKERAEMLIALRQIMTALKSENHGTMGSAVSNKEMTALKAENEELKKMNAKQKYRIEHLVQNLKAVTDDDKSK